MRHRTTSATAALFALVASACARGHVDSLQDLCQLADLPSSTPAQVHVVKQRSSDLLQGHTGKASANTSRNKHIFTSAVYLQMAAEQADFDAQASGSLKSLLPLLRSGQPQIVPTLSQAQSDLRKACES
jgi:hypothetical protein